jgi:plasmid stability protein
MSTIMVDLPIETYKRLQYQARRAGKPPEIFMRDVLESALQADEQEQTVKSRSILAPEQSPLITLLSEGSSRETDLEELRSRLSKISGKMSDVVSEIRDERG